MSDLFWLTDAQMAGLAAEHEWKLPVIEQIAANDRLCIHGLVFCGAADLSGSICELPSHSSLRYAPMTGLANAVQRAQPSTCGDFRAARARSEKKQWQCRAQS